MRTLDAKETYDVIVVGAGPAGYAAAIRCAQLGLDTACIDDWIGKDGNPSLGGTCFNAGCIPSRTLLETSEQFRRLRYSMADQGIKVSQVELDLPAMIKHKDEVVRAMSQSIAELFAAHAVKMVHGHGRLLDGKRIEVIQPDAGQSSVLSARHIVLATGSSPIKIDAAPFDGEYIVDSYDALNFATVPRKLGIIGASVIGVELASIWSRLGSEVVLLDAQHTFFPFADRTIASEAFTQFLEQGLDIRLSTRVTQVKKTPKQGVSVHYEDKERKHHLMFDKVIVAVGREPLIENLFAPGVNILLDENGFIHVDEQCMTILPGIYAIGDLIHGPMLAHKGMEEAMVVAEVIAGKDQRMRYHSIPSIIYTAPEIAWVGQTEQALEALGEKIHVGLFPFQASGRARVIGQPQGLVKLIASAATDQILGVHILGAHASELIAEAVLALEYAASAEDLARTIHPHPTLVEAIQEAALAVGKRALHLPPR